MSAPALPLPLHRPRRQPSPPAPDLDQQLRSLAVLSEDLDQAHTVVCVAVVRARAAGATWRALGDALGLPFKTVYNRFGDLPGVVAVSAAVPSRRDA